MINNRNRLQYLLLTVMFAVLTAIGAFLKIPVGPVPISLQFLFVCLAGICLGPKLGALSQAIYVGLGLMGLPIFTSGGGPAYVFNPSFGYLISFIPAAAVIGLIAHSGNGIKFSKLLVACASGILLIYMVGVPYMYVMMHYVMKVEISFAKAFMVGFAVFIPGDLFKCLFSAYMGKIVLPVLQRQLNVNDRTH